MNKKGFTLVEIIACLVIITLIASIVIISLNNPDNENSKEEIVNTVKQIYDVYTSANIVLENTETLTVYIEDLINMGLIDENGLIYGNDEKIYEDKTNGYDKAIICYDDNGYKNVIYPYKEENDCTYSSSDTEPPTIDVLERNANSIKIKVNDNVALSEYHINGTEGTLSGTEQIKEITSLNADTTYTLKVCDSSNNCIETSIETL